MKNYLEKKSMQFLLALFVSLCASIIAVALYWNAIKADPLEQTHALSSMLFYVGATGVFVVIATVFLVLLKKEAIAVGIYTIAFFWLAFYAGQRVFDFNFFYDYRYKRLYQIEKDKYKPQVAVSLLKQGMQALGSGDLNTARRNLYTALEFDTTNAQIYSALGNLFMRIGSPDTALFFFHEGLSRDYEQPMIHNYVGVLSAKMENFQTAENAFKAAILIDTSLVVAQKNLENALENKRLYEEAVAQGLMKAQIIVVNDKKTAETIRRRVTRENADFGTAALRHSIDPTGKDLGITPFFGPATPPDLRQITASLDIGEISDVKEINGKFVLVKRLR